jgi:hypothetical protein
VRDVLTAVNVVPEKMAEWQRHLTSYQISQLIQHPELNSIYRDTLHADFDSLCEYDRLKEQLMFYEVGIFSKLHDHLESWDATEAEQVFQNSIRLAWIGHIETKYPILRSVSSFKMEALQSELQQCVVEKEKLSKEILIVRARERVYESLEYNRLNNLVTYRDLLHQVTKKKKVWPVRKLISDFHYELFQLIPCWLASPESVSAIFPMASLFDVVIFDEASQCFSERGIPAMFRGKQVVVAGDEKQLRPRSRARSRPPWRAAMACHPRCRAMRPRSRRRLGPRRPRCRVSTCCAVRAARPSRSAMTISGAGS